MSEENVEVVRKGYDAFARRDLDAIGTVTRKYVAPNAEFESVLTDQVYTGVQGAYELAADLWETLPDYGLAVEEIIDRSDQVVAVLRISGTGASSGVPVSQQVAFVWTFEGGKIVRGPGCGSRRRDFLGAVPGSLVPLRPAQGQ